MWVLGDRISAWAVSAPPVRQDTSPGGKRAAKCSMNFRVDKLVDSAGLTMQAFPAASDAATVQTIRRMGKLNGMMWTETPSAACTANWNDPVWVVPAILPASSRAISAK